MASYLIPVAIILVSAFGILFIFWRKMRELARRAGDTLTYPEIGEAPNFSGKRMVRGQERKKEEGKVRRELPLFFGRKHGDSFTIFMEKFFRRMRIHLMKWENWLTGIANNLRERRFRKDAVKKGADIHINIKEKEEGGEQKEKSTDASRSESVPPATFIALNEQNTEFDENYWIEVLKQESKNSYPCKKLGEIYMARKDYREARSILRYALRIDPNDAEIIEKLEGLRGKRTKRKTEGA